MKKALKFTGIILGSLTLGFTFWGGLLTLCGINRGDSYSFLKNGLISVFVLVICIPLLFLLWRVHWWLHPEYGNFTWHKVWGELCK